MAIVRIGLPIDENTIRIEAGQIALELHQVLARGRRFKENCLDRITDPDLGSIGFTTSPNGGDVAILRSAMLDVVQLDDIARGDAALASAKDFFVFLGQLSGVR